MHSGHIHPPIPLLPSPPFSPIKPPSPIHVVLLHIFILCKGERNNVRTLWWWGDGKCLVGMSCPGTHKLTAATSTSISSSQEWVPKDSVTDGGEVNGVLPHPEVLVLGLLLYFYKSKATMHHGWISFFVAAKTKQNKNPPNQSNFRKGRFTLVTIWGIVHHDEDGIVAEAWGWAGAHTVSSIRKHSTMCVHD